MKTIFTIFTISFFALQVNAQCWSKVSSGFTHTVAIATNGTLWAWGDSSSGQLGDGTLIEKYTPIQIGTANNWIDVVASGDFSIALRENGVLGTSKTLWAWGGNYYGQLGDGTNTRKLIPTQIGGVADWQQITVGNDHVLAIKATGVLGANRFLFAWGRNNEGQLGDGTITNSNTPIQITNDNNWEQVDAGENFSVGLKTNGKIYSWGGNQAGQLGVGTLINVGAPNQIGIDANWSKIAAGIDHVLATKTNGTLYSWGGNLNGQLGIGAAGTQSTPVQVGTATNWLHIAAGGAFSICSKTNGTLFSWGVNGTGQLGINSLVTTLIRTQIGSGSSWTNPFSAGYINASAIQTDGSLWTWGNNQNGQLGIGTNLLKTIPTQVNCPAVLSIEENTINDTAFSIYPNPAADGLFSIQSKNEIQEVKAYDMLGKQIEIEKNNDSFKINASSGIYNIIITDSEGIIQNKKLIIK